MTWKILHDVKQNTDEKVYCSTYRSEDQEGIHKENQELWFLSVPVSIKRFGSGPVQKHKGRSLSTLMPASGYTIIVGNMDLLSDIFSKVYYGNRI